MKAHTAYYTEGYKSYYYNRVLKIEIEYFIIVSKRHIIKYLMSGHWARLTSGY